MFFNLPLCLLHNQRRSMPIQHEENGKTKSRPGPMQKSEENWQTLILRTSCLRVRKPVIRGSDLDLKYHESRGHKKDYLCVPADWEQSDYRVENMKDSMPRTISSLEVVCHQPLSLHLSVTFHSCKISKIVLNHHLRQQNQYLEKSLSRS